MFSDVCLLGAPHTSQTCFFFFGVYFCSLAWVSWALRTRHKLAFSFWRVLLFSGASEMGAPHTSQTCFFFFGVYFCSLEWARWALRTRHKLAFSFGRVLTVLQSCLLRKFPFRHDPSRLPGHAYSTNFLSGMTRLAFPVMPFPQNPFPA